MIAGPGRRTGDRAGRAENGERVLRAGTGDRAAHRRTVPRFGCEVVKREGSARRARPVRAGAPCCGSDTAI
ncbi:hypothetical protein GCM10010515_42900 [Streptomyces fructofermentans]|uniref:Uncharacterized protein n=1 Tax=Streptomyces fructofermentans TaxID=152141 RepID=A0A918NIZ6_9ACTN|nr:hypothetical protein GCM10010515_42900 [Streptomyces fructofermentans]